VISNSPAPSKTGQILGGLTSVLGLLGGTGAFGKGGWLHFKDGGKVEFREENKSKSGLGWLKD
jgi:hypothetical protein